MFYMMWLLPLLKSLKNSLYNPPHFFHDAQCTLNKTIEKGKVTGKQKRKGFGYSITRDDQDNDCR